jgi:hypothetical protein
MKPRVLEQDHRLSEASVNADDVLARAVRMAIDQDPSSTALASLRTRIDSTLDPGGVHEPARSNEQAVRALPRSRGIALIAILGLGTTLLAKSSRDMVPARARPPMTVATQPPPAENLLAPLAAPMQPGGVGLDEGAPPPVKVAQRGQHRRREVAPIETRSELELLRAAQLALPNAPANALEYIQAHARAYPHGVLEQERELLAIEALLVRHEFKAAHARAQAFSTSFPRSVHARRLERLFIKADLATETKR